jgi:hypothetical protein
MSSRNMRLLPWAALRSDSEQVGHNEYDLMLKKMENTETKMDAKVLKGVRPFLSHFECLHNLSVKVLKGTVA